MGGTGEDSHGILANRREVRELAAELTGKRTTLETLQTEIAELERSIQTTTERLAGLDSERHRQDKTVLQHELHVARLGEELDRLARRETLGPQRAGPLRGRTATAGRPRRRIARGDRPARRRARGDRGAAGDGAGRARRAPRLARRRQPQRGRRAGPPRRAGRARLGAGARSRPARGAVARARCAHHRPRRRAHAARSAPRRARTGGRPRTASGSTPTWWRSPSCASASSSATSAPPRCRPTTRRREQGTRDARARGRRACGPRRCASKSRARPPRPT